MGAREPAEDAAAPERTGSPKVGKKQFAREIQPLYVELVKLQNHLIHKGGKLLVLVEGRDAAGKDSAIKRIVRHLSPRETRIVALPKPSDRERSQWHFQRWIQHLPAAGEIVLFNRSWYNRAGVERVMGFCNDEEYEEFFQQAPLFEQMLAQAEIQLFKVYLDISKKEQRARLDDRKKDPLKQWKISPIDSAAQHKWDEYSKARDLMLSRTHSIIAPWTIVRSDHKKTAQIHLIRELLSRVHYARKDESCLATDARVVFPFEAACLEQGRLAE